MTNLFVNTLMSEAAGTNLAGNGKGTGGGDQFQGNQTGGVIQSVDAASPFPRGARCVETVQNSTNGLVNLSPNAAFGTAVPFIRLRMEIQWEGTLAGEQSVVSWFNGSTRLVSWGITANGSIVIRDGAASGGANMGTPTYKVLYDSRTYRLEIKWLRDASVGTFDYDLFEGADSTSAVASGRFTGKNTGASDVTSFRLGAKAATSTQSGLKMRMQQVKMDDVNDGTWIGSAAVVANNYVKDVADSITITDTSLSQSLDEAQSMSDQAGVTDQVTLQQALARSLADATPITELMVQSIDASRPVADPEPVTDLVTVQRSVNLSINDGVVLADSINAEKAGANSANSSDSEIVMDTVTVDRGRVLSPSDNEPVTDQVVKIVNAVREPSDAVGVTDVVSVQRTIAISDGVTTQDQLPYSRGQGRALVETETITDVVVKQVVKEGVRASLWSNNQDTGGLHFSYWLAGYEAEVTLSYYENGVERHIVS